MFLVVLVEYHVAIVVVSMAVYVIIKGTKRHVTSAMEVEKKPAISVEGRVK